MSKLKVVPIGAPPERAELVVSIEKLLERTRAGEFETIVVIGFAPGGAWLMKECGKSRGKLETIGLLETLKADFIASTETDLPSGL